MTACLIVAAGSLAERPLVVCKSAFFSLFVNRKALFERPLEKTASFLMVTLSVASMAAAKRRDQHGMPHGRPFQGAGAVAGGALDLDVLWQLKMPHRRGSVAGDVARLAPSARY